MSDPVYGYEIGLTELGLTNVEELTTPVNAPRGKFNPASVYIDRPDGSQRGLGFPSCVWHFDSLSAAMLAQLRTFCPGYSADVFITTRLLDDTFASYSAVMIWPSPEQMEARTGGGSKTGFYQGLEFTFRRLVAV
jgi:hypothetical protein